MRDSESMRHYRRGGDWNDDVHVVNLWTMSIYGR